MALRAALSHRNSCVRALQPAAASACFKRFSFVDDRGQSFDLTEFDSSPPSWVACHDNDEQHARLASHVNVWKDNG